MAEKQKLSESDTIILSLHERWWKKMLAGGKDTGNQEDSPNEKTQSCLTDNQIREYAGESKQNLWGWAVTEVEEYCNPHPLNFYG